MHLTNEFASLAITKVSRNSATKKVDLQLDMGETSYKAVVDLNDPVFSGYENIVVKQIVVNKNVMTDTFQQYTQQNTSFNETHTLT